VKRRGRQKQRPPIQHTREGVIAHRELEYLRHPSGKTAAKLKAVKRGKLL
jgi:hypothetical protein